MSTNHCSLCRSPDHSKRFCPKRGILKLPAGKRRCACGALFKATGTLRCLKCNRVYNKAHQLRTEEARESA